MARGSPAGASVVSVCFDGQERTSRRGEADILMDKPLTHTEPGLDDLSPVSCCCLCLLLSQTDEECDMAWDVLWSGCLTQEGPGPGVVRRQEGLRCKDGTRVC